MSVEHQRVRITGTPYGRRDDVLEEMGSAGWELAAIEHVDGQAAYYIFTR